MTPALLAESKQSAFYREWLNSFLARDIQRLFVNTLLRHRQRHGPGQQ